MKSLPWWFVLAGLALAVAFGYDARGARSEAARLTAANDSLRRVTARVDTQYRVDTATFTRWRTVRDTLRDSLTLTDTVEVVRFIAVQDSTIAACSAALLTCEQRVAVRDARLAVLDSLNRNTERRLRAERGKRWRDALLVGGAAYLAGRAKIP